MIKNNYDQLITEFDKLRLELNSIDTTHGSDIIDLVNKDTLHTFSLVDINNLLTERKVLLRGLFNDAKRLKIKISSESLDFANKLTFFDKFLGGFFGNRDNYKNALALESLILSQSEFIGSVASELEHNLKGDLSRKERNLIHFYLLTNDNDYSSIHKDKDDLLLISSKINELISEADSVISSISSSEGMETLDMFTSGKGISAISSISTSSTNDSIRRFQSNVKKFYDFYREDLETLNIVDFVGDMFELGGGFDLIMGFAQLDSLGKTKDRIKEVRVELTREVNTITSEANKLERELQDSILAESKF